MKPLLPTLKEKKRYLVFTIASEKPINDDRVIVEHIRQELGLFDGARAGLLSIKFESKKQRGVLRVAHNYVDKVKTTFLTLKKINNTRVRLQTIGVSGILKKTIRFEV